MAFASSAAQTASSTARHPSRPRSRSRSLGPAHRRERGEPQEPLPLPERQAPQAAPRATRPAHIAPPLTSRQVEAFHRAVAEDRRLRRWMSRSPISSRAARGSTRPMSSRMPSSPAFTAATQPSSASRRRSRACPDGTRSRKHHSGLSPRGEEAQARSASEGSTSAWSISDVVVPPRARRAREWARQCTWTSDSLRCDRPVHYTGGSPAGRIDTSAGPIAADAVVLACPAYMQAELLADLDDGLAREVAAIPYNRIAVVALGYRRTDCPHSPDGFGYIAPQNTRRDVLGVQWCSAIFPDRARRVVCCGGHCAAASIVASSLTSMTRRSRRRSMPKSDWRWVFGASRSFGASFAGRGDPAVRDRPPRPRHSHRSGG